jgi:antitoxin component YwqK of YwqJK toxin-antitoxin module
MVQKERLLNNIIVASVLCLFAISCNSKRTAKEEVVTISSFYVDTTAIPNDTVFAASKDLVVNNRIYYLKGKPFSGYLKDTYENNATKLVYGYLDGMQHGKSISYYSDGRLRDCRMYKENKSFGKHYGFWENGNMKFEYYYLDDRREGSNKQWYQSGKPYAFLNFKNDREAGMQQAWRENGKAYINYEAKDGFRYGLQKSGLCYTMENEKFKPYKP